MSKPVSGLNVFQAQAGPIPLSQLDANFTLQTNALNDTATYSNYFADSSGAANIITVTVTAPLLFSYQTGISLQVKLSNTNTSTTVNINVNALGNKAVINNDGSLPAIGSLLANSILSLMYDGVSLRLLAVNGGTSFITTGLFGDGSVTSPSNSYAADPNTGSYRPGADTMAFAAGGVFAGAFRDNGGGNTQLVLATGSASVPGLAFNVDNNTGLHSAGADLLAIDAGGAIVFEFSTTQSLALDGSAAAPGFSYINGPAMGMYRIGANDLGFSTAGALRQEINASGLTTFTNANLGISVTSTGASAPITFTPSGQDQYRIGAGSVNVSDLGLFNITRSQSVFEVVGGASGGMIRFTDGTAALPSPSWISDPDTGLYKDTANQIGIALGGVTAGQIAQGSFTGTMTGVSGGANTTGTVFYQRVGKMVHLWITTQIIGTASTATTMTLTGLPAIIQTSANVDVPTTNLRNDATAGAVQCFGIATVNAGTITFALGTTAGPNLTATTTGFTGSSNKGIFSGWSITYVIQ